MLAAVPGGALLPSWASAQEPGRVDRMAVISPSEATVEMIGIGAAELARRGFVVGRNLTVTTYWPAGAHAGAAREAIATKPDVVVAVSNVAIRWSRSILDRADCNVLLRRGPSRQGVGQRLARPGGARRRRDDGGQVDGKRASLLDEFVPAARRIAILSGARLAMWRAPRSSARGQELGLETDVFYADDRRTMSQRSPACAQPAPRR